jgi:hypothetical protein
MRSSRTYGTSVRLCSTEIHTIQAIGGMQDTNMTRLAKRMGNPPDSLVSRSPRGAESLPALTMARELERAGEAARMAVTEKGERWT